MLDPLTSSCTLRLCGVPGFEGRTNDVIYCKPRVKSNELKAVVYFGGDIQDFPESMEMHQDHKKYSSWNLDNTAAHLSSRFADSHVLIVRPFRIGFKTFSCYDNFVPSSDCGVPEHTPTHHALQHLECLLKSISAKLKMLMPSEPPLSCNNELVQNWKSEPHLDEATITLVGFSKGCVVLNQFLYEFHYMKTLTPDDTTMMRLVSNITDMYWLEGGHAGVKNTWITSRSLLETLTRLNIRIHVHVTPYQICDKRRPWIRKEEKTFSNMLKRLGAPIERVFHFENHPTDLSIHFEVLSVFKTPQL
ncbi:unnamed protein product [Bemisia tabaci]|uniref:Uncharacterized protein n=1 Tax=Bemisia tabaci TaxID=7038 RepID=A0A9P0A1Y6_BEMTA|nr:PREDICTED: UPF0565 protein C2orf69 homolog isoform X2 [Bemisia tabaci]CAH0382518.1 unnamed protein product [Bemisia tabaci]